MQSVWAEDAKYGIGRVDWERLLCANKKGNGPGRGEIGKAAFREPDGAGVIQKAPCEEQPQDPQGCCNGGGDDQGPLCDSHHPEDGGKILQAFGPEIGAIGATENRTGVDPVSDKNLCFADSCHPVMRADMCCSGCCLADAISCFGLPVQEGVDFQRVDVGQGGGLSVQVDGDVPLLSSAHEIAFGPVQTTDSALRPEQGKRTCQDGELGQDPYPRREQECCPKLRILHFDLEHACVSADFVQGQCQELCQAWTTGDHRTVAQDGRFEQIRCHFDLEHFQSEWDSCRFQPTHGVELQCLRISHVSALDDLCQLPKALQTLKFCSVDHGHCDGENPGSGSDGVGLVSPSPWTLGFRPFPCQEHAQSCQVPRSDCILHDHLGPRTFDPCGTIAGVDLVQDICLSGHGPCKQVERSVPRICHFDLEHDERDRWWTPVGELVPCRPQMNILRQDTCHFDLEHETVQNSCFADARGGCAQTCAEDFQVSTMRFQVLPTSRTLGFRPLPQCVNGEHYDALRRVCTPTLSNGFRPLDPNGVHAQLLGAQTTAMPQAFECIECDLPEGDCAQIGAEGCTGSHTNGQGYPTPWTLGFRPCPRWVTRVPSQEPRWMHHPSIPFKCRSLDPNAKTGATECERLQFDEPYAIDCVGCDFLGGPLFSLASQAEQQQDVGGPYNVHSASASGRWKWMPRCLVGIMQWACAPSKVEVHCYLHATRVGEASNPGPDSVNSAGAPAFDVGSLLGPQFGTMLQNFIQQQIQTAVQAAVQEAMKHFQSSFQAPPSEERAPQEGPQPKRRRKGKGEGSSNGETKPPANAQTSADAKAKGKGKAHNKVEDPKAQHQGGRGGDKPPHQKGSKGKGDGGKAPTPSSQPKADHPEGWTKVERKRDNTKDAQFELRQQDWNSPLVSFGGLAKRLQETKEEDVCRGVILCPRKDVETARALFAGTSKKYAFLLIVLAKEYSETPEGCQVQKVPGKVGNILRAQDAYLQHAVSKGQQAPQPTGISSVPQKVATKATAVLFVKVPKAFAEAAFWKSFVEKPQRQVAQWTAARHVLCIDCFNWAEEQLQGGRRQVHGVIRVAQADVSTLLAYSGEQGVFLQQPRDQVKGQHVEWSERVSKSESDADYLVRTNRARGDLGLVCRDLSIGWRRPNDAATPVRRVWVLEHAPKTWDLQQVAVLLQEQFSDISMFRQIHRGGWKNFIFRAACKRGSDVDLVPVTVILDEPGGSNAPVTLWAKIAPPRHVEFKQRQIRGGAVPYVDKPSLFDPVAVAGAAPKAEAQEGNADSKGKPVPDPKRTCAAKRPVPDGTVLQQQPADGDCLFQTFSAGLHFLRKDKDSEPIHPHELRARTVAHIKRYSERYKPQWEADGKLGPSGKPFDTWEDFLSEIAKTGSFAGDAELKALCRIFDIRVTLVPEAPLFPVCVFHKKASVKRTIAIFHTHHHFDYLAPVDKSYPEEITKVSADPSGGFLVGGAKSNATAFTQSSRGATGRTTWTSLVGNHSSAKQCGRESGSKHAHSTLKRKRPMSQGCSTACSKRSKGTAKTTWTNSDQGACAYTPRSSAALVPKVDASEQALKIPEDPNEVHSGGARPPKESQGLCLAGLDLGTSPEVPPPPVFPRCSKDRGSFQSKSRGAAGARRLAEGTVWTDQDEQGECSSQDLEGCEPGRKVAAPCGHRQATVLPDDCIFRCQRCPFQKKVATLAQFRMTLHNHVKRHHDGDGLPGPVRRPQVQKVVGGAKNMAWKCPKCSRGISKTLRQSISPTVFAQMRRDHRDSHHPEISKEEWSSISRVKPIPFEQQPQQFRRSFAEGCRRRQLTKGVLREVRTPRFPGFQMFIWPVAKHLPGPKGLPKIKQSQQPIHRISLEHGWRCLSCDFASRSLGDVRAHSKSQCKPPKLAHVSKKRRMENFRAIQAWITSARLPKEEAATLTAAVDSAIAAVNKVSSAAPPSSVF